MTTDLFCDTVNVFIPHPLVAFHKVRHFLFPNPLSHVCCRSHCTHLSQSYNTRVTQSRHTCQIISHNTPIAQPEHTCHKRIHNVPVAQSKYLLHKHDTHCVAQS